MGGLSAGAVRPGSHRWFGTGETYHRRHSDLQGPAVQVKPEKNKPSGRHVFQVACTHRAGVVVALQSDQGWGCKGDDEEVGGERGGWWSLGSAACLRIECRS